MRTFCAPLLLAVLCACAADRVMAGKTLARLEAEERSGAHDALFTVALRQCIAEISPDYRTGRGA